MSAAPHPFRIANFRAYWAARLTMTLAQNSMIIIIGWQTYTIARQTMSLPAADAQLGPIGLLQFLPLFVTTPIPGWVADRFDRRCLTRVTHCLQVFGAMVLATATPEGVMGLLILFSLARLEEG